MAGSSKKVIIAALLGNSLIALTKFVAAALTNSSAMLSEGIHSLVDTGNQMLLLYGLKRARKPADEMFPFGHGKEVYFWSFVVAIMVFAVGAGVSIYEGVIRLRAPEPVANVTINYIVLSLALLFEGGAWFFALREFSQQKGKSSYLQAVQKAKDPSIFVVLFEDSAAMLGLAVALIATFLGQVTGNLYFDGSASIIIGLILGATAIWLAYETKGLLIGERASGEVIAGIRNIVTAVTDVKHVNEIATMHMGPEFVLANLSLDFVDDIPSQSVEHTITQITGQIKQQYPIVKRVFIEIESWHNHTAGSGTVE